MAKNFEKRKHFRVAYRNDGEDCTAETAKEFCFIGAFSAGYRSLPEIWMPYKGYKRLIDLMDIITEDAFDKGADDVRHDIRYLLRIDEEIDQAVRMSGDPTAS